MTNQYMNNLYRDLLSNSPQTITIDIPADMGTGQISQIVIEAEQHLYVFFTAHSLHVHIRKVIHSPV